MTAIAFSHSPPPAATMSTAALGALRCALQVQLGRPSPEGALRSVLRLLCDDVRRQGMRAEQLVVLLKQAWLSLPEVRAPGGVLRGEQLARVVSLCIEEFYAPRG